MTYRTLFRLLILPLLVLGLAGVPRVMAAPARPAAHPRPPAVVDGIRETFLPNGLKVVTKEVHSAPVLEFSVWYRVGSRNEHTGITGTSHLLEHMMFKGTRNYQPGEIARLLAANGAEFNAATSNNYTMYYEVLASDRLEMAVRLEADRMVNSRVDKADLDSEMTVVRSEMEGYENDPGQLLTQEVTAAAFTAHPYQWPVIGWRSDVENVPRSAIYHYYKTHYGPNNATIVLVGDFKTEQALALIRRYFGPLPRVATPPPVYTQEPVQHGERQVTVRRPGSLPIVQIAYKTPSARSPDFYALDVINMILSAGRTSRLYQDLVEKRLATDVSADDPSMTDPYLFYLQATAQSGVSADAVEKALLDEVQRLRDTPVSDEELTRAKNQIEAQFVFGRDSVDAQAQQLGYWDATIGDWRYVTTYVPRIRAVTAADVQRVAQKYFIPTARTVGQFLPTTQAGPSGPPPKEGAARVPTGPARPIPLPKPLPLARVHPVVTRFTLPNGIRVVVQENHANNTVSLTGSIPAGKSEEPAGKPGLAAVTAGMLDRGTEQHSALEFARELEDVGAVLSASSGSEVVSFSGRSESKDFGRLTDLLAEMLQHPAFRDDELEQLKGQVQAALVEEASDPGALATRAFERDVYPPGYPLRPATLEEARQSITSMTADDLRSFYREHYGPDQMILAIVGDVKTADVRAALESRFGAWPKNPGSRLVVPPDVPLQPSPVRQVVEVPGKSEAEILWGEAGELKRKDPDYYATRVMNMIVGGGGALNSRLGTVIRDQQGLAYTVYSYFNADKFAGPFIVSMGTNPVNAQKAVTSLQSEVRRIRAGGVTQREVDEAVAFITGSFPVSLETNDAIANVLWEIEFYGLGPDYIERLPGLYRRVTVAEVDAAAKKHLHPDDATLVIAGSVPQR